SPRETPALASSPTSSAADTTRSVAPGGCRLRLARRVSDSKPCRGAGCCGRRAARGAWAPRLGGAGLAAAAALDCAPAALRARPDVAVPSRLRGVAVWTRAEDLLRA